LYKVCVEDSKAKLSFSTVDHLRWDLSQIFNMAAAEGTPALLAAALNKVGVESVTPGVMPMRRSAGGCCMPKTWMMLSEAAAVSCDKLQRRFCFGNY
jgi:hypothetical protein